MADKAKEGTLESSGVSAKKKRRWDQNAESVVEKKAWDESATPQNQFVHIKFT